MKQLDNYEVDNILEGEKESVLKAHEKKTVRKTFIVGMVTNVYFSNSINYCCALYCR